MRTEIKKDRRIEDRRWDVLAGRLLRATENCRRVEERRLSKDIQADGHYIGCRTHTVVYAKRG